MLFCTNYVSVVGEKVNFDVNPCSRTYTYVRGVCSRGRCKIQVLRSAESVALKKRKSEFKKVANNIAASQTLQIVDCNGGISRIPLSQRSPASRSSC